MQESHLDSDIGVRSGQETVRNVGSFASVEKQTKTKTKAWKSGKLMLLLRRLLSLFVLLKQECIGFTSLRLVFFVQ